MGSVEHEGNKPTTASGVTTQDPQEARGALEEAINKKHQREDVKRRKEKHENHEQIHRNVNASQRHQ